MTQNKPPLHYSLDMNMSENANVIRICSPEIPKLYWTEERKIQRPCVIIFMSLPSLLALFSPSKHLRFDGFPVCLTFFKPQVKEMFKEQ